MFDPGFTYGSGCGPNTDKPVKGKPDKVFTAEQEQEFARNYILNLPAVPEANTGDARKVKNCVKILTMVAGTAEFYDQSAAASF